MKQSLMDLGDFMGFLVAHPELPDVPLNEQVYTDKEGLIAAAKLPGARKVYDDSYFNIVVPYGKNHSITFFSARNVACEAVRTEKVEIPARPAYTIDKVVEWKCHPLLAPDAVEQTEEVPL